MDRQIDNWSILFLILTIQKLKIAKKEKKGEKILGLFRKKRVMPSFFFF